MLCLTVPKAVDSEPYVRVYLEVGSYMSLIPSFKYCCRFEYMRSTQDKIPFPMELTLSFGRKKIDQQKHEDKQLQTVASIVKK